MAKITVEECLKNVPNRFDLIMLASKRAHQIAAEGTKSQLLNHSDSKPTIVALQEIENNLIDASFFEKDVFDEFDESSFGDIDERLFEKNKIERSPTDNIELI